MVNLDVKWFYNRLTKEGYTPESIAGILGNIYAESGCVANNVENASGYSDTDYVKKINAHPNTFIHDGVGYGLCQWTYFSRKQLLLDFCKNIESAEEQTEFMLLELNTDEYRKMNDYLKDCENIAEATERFMKVYERPADISKNAVAKRVAYAELYFNEFSEFVSRETKTGEVVIDGVKYRYTLEPV